MSDRSEHWDGVYDAREESNFTWFEAQPTVSCDLLMAYSEPGDAIIDVGGGASRIVDALIANEQGSITVLDVSESALDTCKERLGESAEKVNWISADITNWTPTTTYALWHDRAVFHFLTDADDRANYVTALVIALEPNGVAVIATFAEDGPETCSFLPVVRYSSAALVVEIERLAPGC
ncbi:MAG: class I SAM-dependent methyltransferase, partial [Deltaproteobacteria bacterium]|nr:class I SAM-dependent methyltransferase [Deltaproteobacteria bacterium]